MRYFPKKHTLPKIWHGVEDNSTKTEIFMGEDTFDFDIDYLVSCLNEMKNIALNQDLKKDI